MQTSRTFYTLAAVALLFLSRPLPGTADDVVATHPRVMLTPAIRSQLLARKAANDPFWLRLKARADQLKTFPILPYKWATRTTEVANTIFYDYQGEGWLRAAMPLALAYQVTGDTTYSGKLLEITDEMIRAQTDPDNMAPLGFGPLAPGNYYPTRSLGAVLAVAYDWCYDRLSPFRKAAILSLMNTYFIELHDSAYQRNDRADGNYFVGHLFGSAMMGYASFGDNPRAQEMIDWARIRFDNTPSPLIDAEHSPEDYFAQLFDGGTRPQFAREYNGRFITSAPFKGGVDFQGWAYGGETYNRIIDYMLVVKSATGEDLLATRRTWLSQILRALKHGLMPNRFEIDPSGDFGSDWGAVIGRALPIRLAYTLAGTPDGPGAQHFAYSEIAPNSPYPDFPNDVYHDVYQPAEWEDFFFTDTTRPSVELQQPPYYSGFEQTYPRGETINEAIPYFYMRSSWDTTATWASIRMGATWYDDHQHFNAGHLFLKHANDYLLVDASNWKGATGSIGIVGSSQDEQYGPAATANTLFFDDFGDYQLSAVDFSAFAGGQGGWGHDEVTAAEQVDEYSYIRSDLSSAYDGSADTTEQAGKRLEYFYRSLAYIRPANVFLVFDQTSAVPSTNPRGAYRRHIRWHFPNRPTVAGTTLSMEQGASRLNMAFLLPETMAITTVDETSNPDPCDGTVPGCTPYDFNSGTWRAEVRDPSNARAASFLAVIQPTDKTAPAMTATRISSVDGGMVGARVSMPGRGDQVVMFNTATGLAPTPIVSTTYVIANASNARHTLGGMSPGMRYMVTVVDSVVSVVQMPTIGNFMASGAGVLQFGTAISGVGSQSERTINGRATLSANYPNPFNRSTTIEFEIASPQHVTLVVSDPVGRVVRTLVDADLPGGRHAIEARADGLSNGVYNYTLRGNGFVLTRQCVVMR